MRKFVFWWFLPMLLVMVATHIATLCFGTVKFGSRQNSDDDDDLIIIAARPTRNVDTEEDKEYLRHRVFGEKNEAPWAYEQRGTHFGHTGMAWSKKPLPEIKLDLDQLLQLFAMR